MSEIIQREKPQLFKILKQILQRNKGKCENMLIVFIDSDSLFQELFIEPNLSM